MCFDSVLGVSNVVGVEGRQIDEGLGGRVVFEMVPALDELAGEDAGEDLLEVFSGVDMVAFEDGDSVVGLVAQEVSLDLEVFAVHARNLNLLFPCFITSSISVYHHITGFFWK